MSHPTIDQAMKERLAIADFGLQVQAFVNTRIGKFLVDKASVEVEAGLLKLRTMDATDPRLVLRVQAEVWRAESFLYWLGEAIAAGTQETQQLFAANERHAADVPSDPTGA